MHLSQTTPLDLAFIVSKLGQHMADPCLGYLHIAKRVLQYLKIIMIFRLEYGLNVEHHKAFYGRLGLVGYADSNYAYDTKSKKLRMGYIYFMNRMAIFWSSKRAKTVVVSSTEAEYVALSHVSKLVI